MFYELISVSLKIILKLDLKILFTKLVIALVNEKGIFIMTKRLIMLFVIITVVFVSACGGGGSTIKKDPITVLNVNGKDVNTYISSNIDIAVMDVKTAKTIGSNPYIKKKAMEMFLLVDVFINNKQKEPLTVNSSSFKIIDNQKREFVHSIEGETALRMDRGDSKGFLTKVNPNVGTIFTFVYDVPANLDLNTANLEARVLSGPSVLIPLKVQKK